MARAVALVLASLMLSGAMADAAQKTAVKIRFVLEAYRGTDFYDSQIDELQKNAAELIVKRLREHVPFHEFTTQEGSEFLLTVTLIKKSAPGNSRAPQEVGFLFKLEGARIRANDEYFVFRPAYDLRGTPSFDEFVKEIDITLTEETYRGRLRPLLQHVPIAKTGEMVSEPAGWVIPYQWSDICMDNQSLLRIEHVVRRAAVVLSPELAARANGQFKGQIFCSPVNPSEYQQQLGAVAPGQVSVHFIWITDYKDLIGCSDDFPVGRPPK